MMLETTDGSTWNTVILPSGVAQIDTITCTSVTHCVALGEVPNVAGTAAIVTTDGSTWSVSTSAVLNDLAPVTSVSCPTNTACGAVGSGVNGNGAIVATTDGGVTWSSDPSETDYVVTEYYSVSCSDALRCWTLGSPGGTTTSAIFGTINGGVSWIDQGAPTGGGASAGDAIVCADATDCVAAVDNPTNDELFQTTDGGGSQPFTPARIAGTVSYDDQDVPTCVTAIGATDDYESTATGSGGNDEIDGLPPGTYTLEFDPTCGATQDSPYAIQFYDDETTYAASDQLVLANGQLEFVNAALQLGSSISGTIAAPGSVNPEYICAFAVTQSSGYIVNLAETDATGAYTVSGLPVGNYAVVFDPTCDGYQASDYSVLWYSGSPDYADATAVAVTAGGQAIENIDGTLTYSAAPLVVATTSLPAATQGVPYAATVMGGGGTPPYRYGEYGLPAGLTFESSTGVISGSVTANPGDYSITIAVADNTEPFVVASTTLSLVVDAPTPTTTTTTTTTTTLPPSPAPSPAPPSAPSPPPDTSPTSAPSTTPVVVTTPVVATAPSSSRKSSRSQKVAVANFAVSTTAATARASSKVTYAVTLLPKKGRPMPTGTVSVTTINLVKVTIKVKGRSVTKNEAKSVQVAAESLTTGGAKIILSASSLGIGTHSLTFDYSGNRTYKLTFRTSRSQ